MPNSIGLDTRCSTAAETAFAILEHEAMHQETLLYMWHRLPFDQKRRRPVIGRAYRTASRRRRSGSTCPAGRATLGVDRGAMAFGWDNESPHARRRVPAFAIERHDVTNARFLDFVEAGGYDDRSGGQPTTGSGFRANSARIRCSGSARRQRGSGAACSN